ncbi:MAG: heavy metal transporter [Cytophagaceae bacterium SCN 52-12]|nr:MAG: heavy metal transporter [Cytophagaceae bacterium SCN 52-12]
MKQIASLLIALFLTTGFLNAGPGNDTKEVKIQTSAKCKMCKSRLERNLGLSKGVEEASLNLDNKVMTVRYNPRRTSEEKICETIAKTGYHADNMPAVESAHDKLPKCCQRTAEAHPH